jgi:cation transport protein ChaC
MDAATEATVAIAAAATGDPFRHHPELRDKITDPQESFFRTFRIESVLEKHPELEWVVEFFHTDEERERNRLKVLSNRPDEDLWIFAYGSLMWDPALKFTEVRRARVPDYARRFILKDTFGGRGSRESPGLMAALDHGDGCEGLIFRIDKNEIDVETEILWRRELVAPTYHAEFVTAISDDQTQQVLTFTADHHAEQICLDISRDEQIEFLINGKGILGTSMEYLENIVAQFETLGIDDAECTSLLVESQARCQT